MINYAHRGASEYAPENTMASFFMALQMDANGMETDIRASSDGVLVLHHDATLLRTAGIDRKISDMSFAELSQADVGSFKGPEFRNERIPRLHDYLYYLSGKPLYFAFEIKQSGIEHEALEMIREFLPDSRFTVTSFMLDSLLELRRESIKPRLGLLAKTFSTELLDTLKENGIEEYCPKAVWLTEEMVREVRARGLGLRVWGVSTEKLMKKMCAFKVDGMTVNFPDKLAAYLARERI